MRPYKYGMPIASVLVVFYGFKKFGEQFLTISAALHLHAQSCLMRTKFNAMRWVEKGEFPYGQYPFILLIPIIPNILLPAISAKMVWESINLFRRTTKYNCLLLSKGFFPEGNFLVQKLCRSKKIMSFKIIVLFGKCNAGSKICRLFKNSPISQSLANQTAQAGRSKWADWNENCHFKKIVSFQKNCAT